MQILTESFAQIFERDINKLEEEIKLYPDEPSLWIVKPEIKNSAGNLCLHLCGNLQHFIGKVLGDVPYERNRDFEFSAKDVPLATLINEIAKTRKAVIISLYKLQPADFGKNYPVEVFGHPMTTTFFLIHLAAHLSYHLGQINYHRRLIGNWALGR